MITGITLGGISLLSNQIYVTGIQNASFPATVYTRSKRGGYQGNRLPTPTFASYQFVLNFTIIGLSFNDLAIQRFNFFQTLGLIHSTGTQTLVITRTDGKQFQIDIKAVQVTGDMSSDDGMSSQVQVTLEAEYPFLQNALQSSQDVLIFNGGGMSVPMGVPLNLSNGQSQVVTITNNGNYPAYPIFTFVGKLTNPTITNNLTGQTLSLNYSLADNTQSIVVDCYQRTVLLLPSNNIGRQYASGVFWTVPIGQSTVTLGNANNSDGGKCTITFRDTFLNV